MKSVLAGLSPVGQPNWKVPLSGWQLASENQGTVPVGVTPAATLRVGFATPLALRLLHLPFLTIK